MREPIAAPPAQPPRYGLLNALSPIEDGARWQGGFKFQPEGCGQSGRVSADCGGSTAVVEPDASPAIVEGDPFVVWAGDKCSSFGFNERDWAGRARRQLEATRSYEMANEVWTGSLAAADGLVNRPLADPAADTLTNGGADVVDALACLEGGLALCGEGRRGLVHVTPQVLVQLAARFAVYLSGTTWVTPNGNIVVADAGYDGSSPDGDPAGATQWAYATSMMGVRLGVVDVIPNTLAAARDYAAAMDRSLNDVIVLAEQLVAVQWDHCCHLAAEIDLPTCLVAGVS